MGELEGATDVMGFDMLTFVRLPGQRAIVLSCGGLSLKSLDSGLCECGE